MSTRIAIRNGRIVTPEAVVEGDVLVEDGQIAAVGETHEGVRSVDAGGQYVLPGLVDLHGDDIESHLFPRAGVRMDPHMAVAAADRANLAAGVTTKFHAVAFEQESGGERSPDLAAELVETVTAATDLVADHRLHARCEVTQPASVSAVLDVIESGQVEMVSVMSHVPGQGQFQDAEAFMQYYRESTDHSVEEARSRLQERQTMSPDILRDRVDTVLAAARAADVVTASHDDDDPAEVQRLASRGVSISEYPITLATARRASELGLTTAMGAPNLVRGESQWDNLEAAAAIEADALDVLVADYHPMSLLASVFIDTGEPLHERVARVTRAPAAAVGLDQRGQITPGARADLIVVDPEPTPTVTHGIVAGRPAYRAEPNREIIQGHPQ